MESEDIVLSNIGNLKKQDYWHRPSIPDSSQRRVQPDYSGDGSEVVKKPIGNWRALVDAALRSQNVDLMVRDQSRPDPPADSGWVSCKQYQIAHLAHAERLIRNRSLLRSLVSEYKNPESKQHLGSPPRAYLSKHTQSQTPAFLVLAEAHFLLRPNRSRRPLIPLRFLFLCERQRSNILNPLTAGSTRQHLDGPPRASLSQNSQIQRPVFPVSATARCSLLRGNRPKLSLIPPMVLFPCK